MYLELAEGYTPPPMYNMSERPRRKRNRSLSEQAGVEDNPYVFVPDFSGRTGGFMAREDNFDDLTDREWNEFMYELAPYQPQVQQGMSEQMFLADRASRKAKREQKRQDKASKNAAKVDKKNAKSEIKKARAEKIRAGGGEGGGWLEKISGALGGVAGAMLGITPANAQTPGADSSNDFWNDTIAGVPYKIAIPGAVLLTVAGVYGYRKLRKRRRK